MPIARRNLLGLGAATLPAIAFGAPRHAFAGAPGRDPEPTISSRSSGEAPSPTRMLADFAVGFPFDRIPPETRQIARELLLDTLGCAIAGANTRAGAIMAKHLGGDASPRMATMASGGQVHFMSAAMANCTMANALDYDAYGPTGHLATVVVPVALSTGEAFGASGRDIVQAICLGMEIGGRIGGALRRTATSADPLTGHTFAIFGAAAAAGRIMGLSPEQMLNAFGIAGYSAQLPTLRRFFSKPQDAMTKYDHLGLSARNGIDAAMLAKAGFTGDRTILEGPQAFWRLSGAEGCDWDYMTGGLGEHWVADETRLKAYPVGVGTVTALDALKGILADNDLSKAQIHRVIVRTMQSYVHKELEIGSEIEAWTDLRYCVSAMISGIKPYRTWYLPEIYRNTQVTGFMQNIEILQLPAQRADGTKYEAWAAEVEVHSTKGIFTDWRNRLSRMSRRDIEYKFLDNASIYAGKDSAERIVKFCNEIEYAGDLSALRHNMPTSGRSIATCPIGPA